MAYAIVGTTNGFTQAATAAALSLTFSGTQPRTGNDLLILPVAGTGTATFPTTPAGWSVAVQRAGTSCSATVFYKVAAGADASPVVAALAGTQWGGILWEFSGGAISLPVDQTGSNVGTTASPIVATAGGTDAASGELVISAAAQLLSVAATDTLFLQTGPNGQGDFGANQQGNDGTSTVNHSNIAWGVRTTNSSADSVSVAHKTTSVTGIAVALASFKLATAVTAVPPRTSRASAMRAAAIKRPRPVVVVPPQVPVPTPVFPNRVPALARRVFAVQPRGRQFTPTPSWFSTTSVLDPFNNRPAENPTLYGGRYVPTFGPLSNALAQTDGTFGLTSQVENTGSGAVWSVPFATPVEAFVTLATVPGGANDFAYIGAFAASPFTSGYELRVQTSVSGWLLGRWDSAVRTTLASGTQPLANGGAIGLSIDPVGVIVAWYCPPGGDWLPLGGAKDTTYGGPLSIGWRTVDTLTRFSNFGGGTTGVAVGPLFPFALGGTRLAGRRIALPPTRGRRVFPTQVPVLAPPPWPVVHRAPEVSQRALVPLLRAGRRWLPVPPPLAPYQITSLSGRKSHSFTATVTPLSADGLLVVTGALWNGGVGVPTISDTWGLGWNVVSGYDATSQALTFVAWAQPTSTTPGTITVGESTGNNSVVMEVLQVTGPVSAANPVANAGSSATATVSLADTPRADSLVISVAGYATGGGQTALSPPNASWGALEGFVKDNFVVYGSAFKDGNAPKTIAWSGGTNLSTVAIEILNANATLGWLPPGLRRPPARVVAYRGSRLQPPIVVPPPPPPPAPIYRPPPLRRLTALIRGRRAEHTVLQYIRFIQRVGASQATATSTSVTPGAATTGGNTLFAIMRIASAVALQSVTDTQGNVWYIDVPSPIPALSGSNSFIARAPNAVSLSTGDSITAHGASSAAIEMVVLEFSGVGAFDQEAWTHQASASDTVTTGQLASFYELAITGYASGSVAQPTITPPKGWIEVPSVPTAWADSAYTLLGESTAAVSASWTAGSGVNSGASLATYLPAALVQMVPAPRGRPGGLRFAALFGARLRPVISTPAVPTAPVYVPQRQVPARRFSMTVRGRITSTVPQQVIVAPPTVPGNRWPQRRLVASVARGRAWLVPVEQLRPVVRLTRARVGFTTRGRRTVVTPQQVPVPTPVWPVRVSALARRLFALQPRGRRVFPAQPQVPVPPLVPGNRWPNRKVILPRVAGRRFSVPLDQLAPWPRSFRQRSAFPARGRRTVVTPPQVPVPSPVWPVRVAAIRRWLVPQTRGRVVWPQLSQTPPPIPPTIPGNRFPAGRRIAALRRGRLAGIVLPQVPVPAPVWPNRSSSTARRLFALVPRGKRAWPTPAPVPPPPAVWPTRVPQRWRWMTRTIGHRTFVVPAQVPIPVPVRPNRSPATARRLFALAPRGRRSWPVAPQVPVPRLIIRMARIPARVVPQLRGRMFTAPPPLPVIPPPGWVPALTRSRPVASLRRYIARITIVVQRTIPLHLSNPTATGSVGTEPGAVASLAVEPAATGTVGIVPGSTPTGPSDPTATGLVDQNPSV